MLDHWPVVGRTKGIAQVIRLFGAAPGQRDIAVAGKAGVGKLRLAREAVRKAAGAGWAVRSVAATVTSRTIPSGTFAAWTDNVDALMAALSSAAG
ncbi:ATP-binding protein [Mycobacterium simiae]|uniref:ATP-binding protein n=1 Tax=Mycobacterium simiae TaxID=1784 RepID=UPI00111BD3AC|nr:ATP-binding protein [Mycobacterium simiae]